MLKGVSPWVLRHLVLCQLFCPGVPVRLMTPAPALGPREYIALFLFSQLRSPEVRFPDFSSPSQDWVFFFFPSLRVAVLSVTQQVLWQGLLHLEGHLQEAPTWAIMRLNGSVSIVLRMMPSMW